MAPEGAVYVIDPRFRKGAIGPNGWLNSNLRTTFLKIIERAGLKPWPKPFHNMRASRETELVERYPIQVVTAWAARNLAVSWKIAMGESARFCSIVGLANPVLAVIFLERDRTETTRAGSFETIGG